MAIGPDSNDISRILIVERDDTLASALADGLARQTDGGPSIRIAGGLNEAVDHVRSEGADIILADLATLDAHDKGFEFGLKRLSRLSGGALLLALSRANSVSSSIAALQSGAHDYLIKPFSVDVLSARLAELGQRHRKAGALDLSQTPDPAPESRFGLVASSHQMHILIEQIDRIASSDEPVFLTGERGTGKSAVATALHRAGSRSGAPFVEIDCRSGRSGTIETEIFGNACAAGAMQNAKGGLLHLKNVDALDTGVQLRLARLLQSVPSTGNEAGVSSTGNVRLVCSTSANLLQMIADRAFREDLFYRLHVLPMHLPPLRQRPSDILPLARHFLNAAGAEQRKISPEAADVLVACDWPGNAGELRQLMVRLAGRATSGDITRDMVSGAEWSPAQTSSPVQGQSMLGQFRVEPMWVQERRIIEGAIARFGGNVARAAEALEISPSTIYRKRQQWDELAGDKGAA